MTDYSMDRRCNVRVLTPSTAVLVEDPVPVALSLINLSTSGALVSASRDLKNGETVRLVMSVGTGGPMQLDARVVRTLCSREGTSEFALAFARPHESVMHLLNETVLSQLSARLREAGREVLVIDRSSAVRRSIRDALGQFGVHDIAEGTSPLDAVTRLVRTPIHDLTSFVGAPAGCVGAVELATFIARGYPHVHVVLLIPAVESPDAVAPPELSHTDIEILAKPWTPERVASFMLPRRPAVSTG